MVRIAIAELVYSLRAQDKMWEHGVTPEQLHAILEIGFYIVKANRADRAASHILYGWDDQGQCIAAPLLATQDRLIWRVITAWYCKPSEITILSRER